MVRGMVSLPAGSGKDIKVAVFARGDKAEAASAAGADKVGAEDLMEDMQAGNLDYDRIIASPDMMGIVGRLGKGPPRQGARAKRPDAKPEARHRDPQCGGSREGCESWPGGVPR